MTSYNNFNYQNILKEIDQKNNDIDQHNNEYYKNHIFVGFWKDLEDPSMDIFSKIKLKDIPEKNLDKNHNKNIVEKIYKLQKIANVEEYFGCSYCRICNKSNGGKEYSYDKYVWPEGYIHYLSDHNIKIDQDFENFINKLDL